MEIALTNEQQATLNQQAAEQDKLTAQLATELVTGLSSSGGGGGK